MEPEKSRQSKGGLARADRLSPEQRKEISQKGAAARWSAGQGIPSGLPKTLRAGEFEVMGVALRCFVLDDGRRVLSGRTMTGAIGMKGRGQGISRILSHPKINPFLSNELRVAIENPILFDGSTSRKANPTGGYEGTILQEICETILKARDAGQLRTAQERRYSEQADILIRAFARIGIIALIDEATGYQSIREKDELQSILAAYLSPTLLPWAERFPRDFFREMFRVWGWPWPSGGETYKGPLGPRYAGKLIKQVIYGNLPPGVLEELEKRNPRDEKWQRRARNSQHLTEDVGHPLVEKLVSSVGTLFAISDNKDDFWRHYHRRFPKAGDQLELLNSDQKGN